MKHKFTPYSSAIPFRCGAISGGTACMRFASDDIHDTMFGLLARLHTIKAKHDKVAQSYNYNQCGCEYCEVLSADEPLISPALNEGLNPN